MTLLFGIIAKDYYLIRDSGYALRPWRFTPVTPEPQQDTPEYRYNEAIKQIRSLIERCIMRGNEDVGELAGANPELEAGRNNRARLGKARFQNN
ncbi:hypothetical protein MTP99_006983 [Tenebrio molitor]|nr:hypothetical protein MTP99_006983 [Tenebrio molitor]